MVDITIYDKNGNEKAVVKSLEYDGTFMGDRYVTVNVSSPVVIDWAVGDCLEYRGERWSLWLLPATSKVARVNTYGGAIEYKDLRFCPTEEELRRCSFLDVVLSDNEIHYTNLPNFSFYCATAKDLADRIQANLDRLYPGQWTISANPAVSITDQSLTFSNNTCWDALAMANTSLGLNFTINSANREIVIGGECAFIETVMEYGKGNGLKSVERTVNDNQQVVNRLYAYGNTRNLPYRYYNKRYAAGTSVFDMVQSMYLPNLMLPGICKGWEKSDADNYLDENGCVYYIYGSVGQSLTYNETTQWFDNLDGTPYEGTVYVLWRHYSLSEDQTDYYCDRVWLESQDSINKCGVQEGTKFFDGSDELVDDIYPSITGFDSTEALATALGNEEAARQNLTYEQGELDEIIGADVDSWDGIIPEEEETAPTFFIRIKNIGFDLIDAELDASGDTPRLSMKSGMCTGREFNILSCTKQVYYGGEWVDYDTTSPVAGAWSYYLKCEVAADDSIGQYFPNDSFALASGDKFVILGIKMPDVYVDVAENRLLKAAIIWLSENDKTAYNYSPAINNIYMAENPETSALLKEGNVLHVYDADLDIDVEMTISQLRIKNDKQIPEYEVTLSNDKEADLVQRVTAQVQQSYTQFIGNGKSGGSGIYLIGTASNAAPTDNNAFSARRSLNMFLRKDVDDTAAGKITFNDIATFLNGANFGIYEPGGFLGAGASIGADGRGEFEEVTVRGALRAAELVFNRISAEEGEAIRSIGHGEILSVDEENMTATLKLEGDEWSTIDVGDICRGLYNTINKDYDNADDDGLQDANGFRMKSGFFASYFKVEEILSNGKGECTFRYFLQPGTTEHPCELMKFAVYGNTNNSKKERQSSMYITAVGIAPRLLFLANVNDWQIKPQNIKIALGNIEGLNVYELYNNTPTLKTLHGDAGIFVEDNIYFGGILNQFTAADWNYIQQHLGQGISAQLLRGSDNIVVDILGNIVGGIYEQYGEDSTGNRHYRLHTGILVYDSGKKKYLSAAADNENIGENEYAIYYTCDGCDVIRDGADFYVTAIHNTNDGLSGTVLTDEQLQLMRMTDECRINFVIVTYSGWRTMMSYPIRITHLDHAYVTFDLDNEFDSISYRSQTKRYDLGTSGVRTAIHAYINGTELVGKFVSVTMESDLFSGKKTVGGNIDHFTALLSGSGLAATIYKSGVLAIDHTSQNAETDLPDAKHYFDISATVKYAGVEYESGKKRFILQENTDATLYKLLLSANAISKDEGTYTPSSIDVKVQIVDNNGSHVYTESELESSGNIKVRYLNGTYDPSVSAATLRNSWLTPANKPNFSDVVSCFTILVADITNSTPVILDVESVTINAIGRDGAGQPWVKLNMSQVFIDCDDTGHVKTTTPITIIASLYWDEQICVLDETACAINIPDEDDDTPNYEPQSDPTTATKTYVFNEGDLLKSVNVSIYLLGSDGTDNHSASAVVSIVANVQGQKGDKGDPGASMRYLGEWESDTYYVWDSIFRDVVKYESSFWLVNKPSDGTTLLGEPGTNDDWTELNNLKFVATELLLAENGTINLLSSQVLRMFNNRSQLTATLNEDGNGSYVIYDGDTGLPMMNYCYDGYIYRYRPDGSVAWRIGLGGEIEKNFTDSWNEFRLFKIDGYPTGTQVTSETEFPNRITYYQFRSGSSGNWSEYAEMIFITQSPANPAVLAERGSIIPDGWYTPNEVPEQSGESIGETSYVITVEHIVNGRIVESEEVTEY